MADGSMIYARSDDSTSVKATKLAWYPAGKGPDEFVALDSPFRCPLPPVRRAFSALERADLPYHWGEAGFNDAGVGMSSTETIFSKKEVLDLDPYVEGGLAENCVFQIILPYISSAREGVLRLGELIEKYGSAEGFGIAFMDEAERNRALPEKLEVPRERRRPPLARQEDARRQILRVRQPEPLPRL